MAGSPMIIPRWAMRELLAQLETHRVVSVVGCRQSGKTTLLLTTPLPNVKFQSLDVQANFSAAVADPSYFVRRRSREIFVIDEIQKVPQLIGEIKFQVDRNPEKVRILICVNGVLKHVNTPDSYLRERCANIVDSVRSLA